MLGLLNMMLCQDRRMNGDPKYVTMGEKRIEPYLQQMKRGL